MRKTVILVILCMLVAVILGKQLVIGVSNLWVGNDWNLFVSNEIKQILKSKGVKVIHTNAMGKTSQQVADVENFLSMGVDGVIIAGGEGPAFFEVSKKLKEAGIPVVGIDMFLPGAISSVASDNYSGGIQIGLFLVKYMGGEGKVIVLDTPGWQTLSIRKRTALAVFSEFPKIEIVGEYEVGTSDPVNSAYNIVSSALRSHPDLKGVLCTWGLPMVGAAQAVKEMGKTNQVVIVGADSDRPVLEEMAKPDAPAMACIGQDPRELGKIAANVIYDAVTKGITNIPPFVFGPTIMVSNRLPVEDFSKITSVDPLKCWDMIYPEYEKPLK